MPREFIAEYGYDPGDYVQQLVDEIISRSSRFTECSVEEAIFVDEGPIDFLVWFALNDYKEHTFFYHDDTPEQKHSDNLSSFLRRNKQCRSSKRCYRHTRTCTRNSRLHAPRNSRTYLPQLGERPRVNLGICHEPGTDQVVSGISAVPRLQEQDIVKDIDKLVPDDDLEKFISRTVWLVNTQIEEKADRQLETDIQHLLDTDPDFRFKTTKPLPKGIHPAYTGTDAELWQKPASRVHYMDGSQGFLKFGSLSMKGSRSLMSQRVGMTANDHRCNP